MPVETRIENEIGIIVFSNPPLNPISAKPGVPQAIEAALRAFDADPAVSAVVLAADGPMFSAGADIAEFDESPSAKSRRRRLQRPKTSLRAIALAMQRKHGLSNRLVGAEFAELPIEGVAERNDFGFGLRGSDRVRYG